MSFWQFANDAQQKVDSGLARVRRMRDDLDLRLQGLQAAQTDYWEQTATNIRDGLDNFLTSLQPSQPQEPDTTGYPGLDQTMGSDQGYWPEGAAETTAALGQTTVPSYQPPAAPPVSPQAEVSLGMGTPEGERILGGLAETATRETPGAGIAEAVLREAAPVGPMTADKPVENTLALAQLTGAYAPISRAPSRAVGPALYAPMQAGARGVMEALPGGETPVIPGVDPDTPVLGGLLTPDVALPMAAGMVAGTPQEAADFGRWAGQGLEEIGRAMPEGRFGAAAGHTGEAAARQPWELTQDEFRNLDFSVPTGGASKTPKTVFSWTPGEDYETLLDVANSGDTYRFQEILGKGWPDHPTSLHLAEKIRRNEPITIYRASEVGDILPGSYVSESLPYVRSHAEANIPAMRGEETAGNVRIYSMEVRPSELMIYGDPHEFIYIPDVATGHRRTVERALAEGRSVPDHVLAEYPDLAQQRPNLLRRAAGALENLGRQMPESRSGVVPVDVARQTPGDVRLPQRVSSLRALHDSPGVRITPEGVWVDLQRFQQPTQAGEPVSREAVYYSPRGSGRAENYRTTGASGEGGPQEITGETLFKRPLVVQRSGEGHGAAPEVLKLLYPGQVGQDRAAELVRAAEEAVAPVDPKDVTDFLSSTTEDVKFQRVVDVLRANGFEPDEAQRVATSIVDNVPESWSQRYALLDAVGAREAREAGYDGILYVRQGEVQEAIEVREAAYPGRTTTNPEYDRLAAAEDAARAAYYQATDAEDVAYTQLDEYEAELRNAGKRSDTFESDPQWKQLSQTLQRAQMVSNLRQNEWVAAQNAAGRVERSTVDPTAYAIRPEFQPGAELGETPIGRAMAPRGRTVVDDERDRLNAEIARVGQEFNQLARQRADLAEQMLKPEENGWSPESGLSVKQWADEKRAQYSQVANAHAFARQQLDDLRAEFGKLPQRAETVVDARPQAGTRLFDGTAPLDTPERREEGARLLAMLPPDQRALAERHLAAEADEIRQATGRPPRLGDVYQSMYRAMHESGVPDAHQRGFRMLQEAGYDLIRPHTAYPNELPRSLALDTGTSTPEAMGLPAPGGAGITPNQDFARTAERAIGLGLTRGDQLASLATGTATGAQQAYQSQQEGETPLESAGRFATGFAYGAAAGPMALRAIQRLGQLERRLSGVLPEAADEAARLRQSIEARSQAWEAANRRLQEIATEIEGRAAKPVAGGIERPAWARGMTDNDLEEIARRSEVNPYEPMWHEQIDPEAVRLYRREVMRGRTAETAGGETPGQARQALAALRKEQTQLRAQMRQFDREITQDLERESIMTERAERDPFPFENAPRADAEDVGLPDWEAINRQAQEEAAAALPPPRVTPTEQMARGMAPEMAPAPEPVVPEIPVAPRTPDELIALPAGPERTQAIQEALTAKGVDPAKTEQFVAELEKVSDPAAQRTMLAAAEKPGVLDYVETLRYASMLSSWKTHLANTLSNAIEAGARPAQLLAVGFGREGAEQVRGMVLALPDAVSAARAAFSEGVTSGPGTLDTQTAGRPFAGSLPGRALRAPIDLLAAADEFWKTLTRQGVLRSEAYRLAGGGRGRGERMAALLSDPSPEMLKAAEAAAQRATYQEDVPEWLNNLMQLRRTKHFSDKTSKALAFAAHMIVPFVRTPWNIAGRAAEGLVPVGPAVRGARALRAGDTRAARLEGAKLVTSGAVALALAELAATGHLTGSGPKDPDQRRALEATGWQPNSVVVPGPDGPTYLGLNTFGPLGLEAMAVANAFEGWQEGDLAGGDLTETASAVGQRLVRTANDATFLRSVGDFLDLVAGGATQGQNLGQLAARWVGGAAGSFVPYGGALAAAERVSSPVLREQENPLDVVAARIPGLAGNVPVRTGFAGQPRRTGTESMVLNILAPGPVSEGRTGRTAGEAQKVYDLRRQRQGTRRFVGSDSAAMDREIARAVEKVQDWRRNPRGAPKPTAEEQELYRRFGGRPNPVYERLGQQANFLENRAGPLPPGAAPTVTLADIFG